MPSTKRKTVPSLGFVALLALATFLAFSPNSEAALRKAPVGGPGGPNPIVVRARPGNGVGPITWPPKNTAMTPKKQLGPKAP